MVKQSCKLCEMDERDWVEAQLHEGVTYADIVAELEERSGQSVSISTLSRHRQHTGSAPDADVVAAVAALKDEAAKLPATLRAPYMILVRFMESVERRGAPSNADAIRAAEAIARVSGLSSKQHALLAYMEQAFPQGPGGE